MESKWTWVAMHACTSGVKNGMPSVHPLQGDEMRALKRESTFVFTSERGTPFTRVNFAKMVARLGQEAGFKFGVHPHMLRHACCYALANRGHDTRALQAYLGHKNIQHTVRYSTYGAIYGTVANAF
jgi:site-specific recombinase XerD